MQPVLRHELRFNYKSMLSWAGALGVLIFVVMYVFPTIAEEAEIIQEYVALFPDSLAAIFGLDRLPMYEPLGFFAVEGVFMVSLFGSIYAGILGANMLAKEEHDRTIEFLLARPISRSQVLTGKLLAVITYIIAFNAIIAVIAVASFAVFVEEDVDATSFALLLAVPALAHLVFASLGFLASNFLRKRGSAVSFSVGMVLGFFFLNVVSDLADELAFLGYLTPFYYIDPVDIVLDGTFNLGYAAVLLGVAAVAIAATYRIFDTRDIAT